MEPWVNDTNKNWGVKTWGKWAIPDESAFLAVIGRNNLKPTYNNVFWQLELSLLNIKNIALHYNETNKLSRLSSICSSKYFDEGHIKRIDFLKYMDSSTTVELDIYNSDNIHNLKNYKGPLTPYVDKSKGVAPYKYYFMMENNFERDFITEKIWEPILCETLVFYYGCPNISDYIDPLAYVELDINDFEKSLNIIKSAIETDLWLQRIDIIRKEKAKILKEMAFFPRVDMLIKQKNISKF
jgi:hypothetical protein